MSERIHESEWHWFGHAAHLCVGQWCRFHMATKIGKLVVSTVGEYVPPMGSEVAESEWLAKNRFGKEIGFGRKYETMVFAADGQCECGCGLPGIDPQELHSKAYNDPKKARIGHLAICELAASGKINCT